MKLLKWLKEYWIEIAFIALPFIVSIATWVCSDEALRAFIKNENIRSQWQCYICWSIPVIAIVYLVFILVFYIPKIKCASQIKAELAQIEKINADLLHSLSDVWNGYLYCLGKHAPLYFCKSECCERISLYKYESSDNHFILLGRYSGNPEYDKKGRAVYKANQGCIAKAWQDGTYYVNDYPDYNQDPNAYIERSKEDNLTQAIVKKMLMKSRMFFGYRLHDESGRNAIAIVLIESTCPDRYTEKELKVIFDGHAGQYLSKLTFALSSMMPSIEQARKAGF